MTNGLAHRLNHRLEGRFPEQRLFLRSDEGTRFITLSPLTQVIGWVGSAAFVAWAIIATAVLLMDSIGSGSLRDQALREQKLYEQRLEALVHERDARATEAVAAQDRFAAAMDQISAMQSELLAAEDRNKELETGINVIQSTLRRTMLDRDTARNALDQVTAEAGDGAAGPARADMALDGGATVDMLTEALNDTAAERDAALTSEKQSEDYAQNLVFEQRLRDERNDQIFHQLEDAVSVSLKPFDKMFEAVGMSPATVLDTVRQGYSGQGGPLMPLALSTMGEGKQPDPDTMRANEILGALDRMNVYRIAAEKLPFAMPVHASFRYTSGFGMRWGRLHAGVDMAAPIGTGIYAPADGVVLRAGWVSGYGRLIEIQHGFGRTTRYGHLSAIKVKVGERVSRGERIGDMGSSGHSTGPHLHYEVRVNNKPIDPMIYIKAGKNVF